MNVDRLQRLQEIPIFAGIDDDALNALYAENIAQFALIQLNICHEISRRLRKTCARLFQEQVKNDQLPPGDGEFYLP